jgi:hypothetical protein
MIELKSIGDRLKRGRYRVHSRFSRAVNFECDGELATIVDQDIGFGPLNIVASGIDFDSVDLLYINDTSLRFADYEIGYNDDIRFRSILVFPEDPFPPIYFSNLMALQDALKEFAPPKSLALLIDFKRRKFNFYGVLEIGFIMQSRSAFGTMSEGRVVKGVRMMRGLGMGLTPGGDDFNAGVLSAYRVAEKVLGRDHSELIESIYANAIGKNLISNAFLKCARDGCFSERQKALIMAVVFGGEEDVFRGTRRLCEIGETSGADWGAGFYLTLNRI